MRDLDVFERQVELVWAQLLGFRAELLASQFAENDFQPTPRLLRLRQRRLGLGQTRLQAGRSLGEAATFMRRFNHIGPGDATSNRGPGCFGSIIPQAEDAAPVRAAPAGRRVGAANRRPASASSRAAGPHRQPAPPAAGSPRRSAPSLRRSVVAYRSVLDDLEPPAVAIPRDVQVDAHFAVSSHADTSAQRGCLRTVKSGPAGGDWLSAYAPSRGCDR